MKGYLFNFSAIRVWSILVSAILLLAPDWQSGLRIAALAYADDPKGVYHIVEEKQLLWEVSLLYYGSLKKTEEIASWNALVPPYRLRRGQRLVLKIQPTVPLEVGKGWVLEYWRQYLEARGSRPKGGSVLFQFRPPKKLSGSQIDPIWLRVTPSGGGAAGAAKGASESKELGPATSGAEKAGALSPGGSANSNDASGLGPRSGKDNRSAKAARAKVVHEFYSAHEEGTIKEDRQEVPMMIQEVAPPSNPSPTR